MSPLSIAQEAANQRKPRWRVLCTLSVRQEFLNMTNKKIKLLQRAKDATYTLPRHKSQNIRNEFVFKVSAQKPKNLIPNFILKIL